MSLDENERFSPYKADGLLMARDQEAHDAMLDKVRKYLEDQREYFEPIVETLTEYEYNGVTHLGAGPDTEYTEIIADHLSQFNGCPLKALKLKQEQQCKYINGEPWRRPLTEKQIVVFSMGYVFQDAIMGRGSEIALWRPYSEDRMSGGFWYSPDAITNNLSHQVKTTRKSPSTKADRYITIEAVRRNGEIYQKATDELDPTYSVEKGILEKFPFYWDYELQTMYLFNRTESYLTFWWINGGEQATFKLTADEDKVAAKGKELEDRIRFQRIHQEKGELPPPDSRLSPSDCNAYNEPCPFLSEDPCLSRIPVLDMMSSVR
jgi:hypothetical protein